MAEIDVPLLDGVKIGESLHKTAVLHEPTTTDIIAAAEASEKLVATSEGPQLVISPTLNGVAMLGRQIAKIGDLPGPLSIEDVGRFITPRDLQILQAKAAEIDIASTTALAEELEKRGRVEGGAGGD